MSSYKTIQRESVLRILCTNADRTFTVKEISEAIKSEISISWAPSESTIYRIMNSLVQSGAVLKSVNNNREYQYSLINNNDPHITVRCKICGKIHHIDENVCREIINELNNNSFMQADGDIEVTGICEECK
ncbi:MAG TPA: transcriptional repressor [Ruminococcus sp.]|nr:transcriptional repressor [Ruminococcus sp.]